MPRLVLLAAMLFGVAVTTPSASALPPDCSHSSNGCTEDWYNDYNNPGSGTKITTCGDYRAVTYGPGGCGGA